MIDSTGVHRRVAGNPMSIRNTDLLKADALVGGRWVEDPSRTRFSVFNPADGSLVMDCVDSGAVLARYAVDAAEKAFEPWSALDVKSRSDLLKRWFHLILDNKEDLARLISWEMGKPISEAKAEVAYGASYIEWFSEAIKHENGDVIPEPMSGRKMLVLREAIGIAAVITPWNLPMAMVARKLAPALAAGCTVVAKPAEDTPFSALALGALSIQAGIPAGVINILPASRDHAPEIAQAWMDDSRVRKISFTGSTTVGKHLARASSENLKRASFELGGDAPFIVFEDADINVAVDALMKAKFRFSGQACIAANRVFIQESVYAEFISRIGEAVSRLTVGSALLGEFDIGPLINVKAVEKVERLIAAATSNGAKVVRGGTRHSAGPNFFAPTIVVDLPLNMRGSCEEVFGPVILAASFSSEEEVVVWANQTASGLASYFCTNDHRRIWRVASRLQTGMVGVNEGFISSEFAPFGGVKESGYGREGSTHGLADYQSLKYVCLGAL